MPGRESSRSAPEYPGHVDETLVAACRSESDYIDIMPLNPVTSSSMMDTPTGPLPLPEIDQALCTGCHRCVDVCPTHALAQIDDKARLAHPSLCTYCTACEDICPENAISLPFLIVLAPVRHKDQS